MPVVSVKGLGFTSGPMGNVHLGLVRGELEAGVNAYYPEGEVATASNHTTLIDPLLIACRIDQAGPGVPEGDKRGKGQGNGLQESGKWAARWGPCSTWVFRMFKEGSLICKKGETQGGC